MDLSLRSVSGILKYNLKIKLNTVLFYSDAEHYELLYGSGFKICDFSIWIKIRPDSRKENSNFKFSPINSSNKIYLCFYGGTFY